VDKPENVEWTSTFLSFSQSGNFEVGRQRANFKNYFLEYLCLCEILPY
jgi:hypothetical protein